MKRYRVIGHQPFEGYAPNTIFEGDLDPGKEHWALALKIIREEPKAEPARRGADTKRDEPHRK